MPCCYEDEKGWCKDLRTVYSFEGKEYCDFHAPQGKKSVSLEAFNELVFARIREAQEKHEPCDLSGTIFEGDIDFSQFNKDNPIPDIDFSGARFNGSVGFLETLFSKRAAFSGARFSGYTYFIETRFSGRVYFVETQFSADTHFIDTQFNRYARFWYARFAGNSGFIDTQFSKEADFNSIHILKKARLTFREVSKTNTFLGKANFKFLDIEGSLMFEGVDFSKTSFANTRIDNIDFVNVRWRRSRPRGWRNTLYDEIALFDGMKEGPSRDEKKPTTPYINCKDWIQRTFFYSEEHGDDIRKVGILYRRMKNKYRTLQNWPEVSNWHYGEKEMYRKENAFRRYLPSFSFLYWLSSGYGERYMRAGGVLAVLIVMLSVGLAWTGLDVAALSGSNPGGFHGITSITLKTLDLKSIGALLMNTLKYATFQKDVFFVPRNMWGEFLRLIAQILIPIQTALFILAVRNRFRR